MFAPCQISSRVVRVPKTASQCSLKTSSLEDVRRQERAVRLGQHDQVPIGFPEPAPASVSVALLRLEHLSRWGLLDLLDRPVLGVVVDDEDLVHDAGLVETRRSPSGSSPSLRRS